MRADSLILPCKYGHGTIPLAPRMYPKRLLLATNNPGKVAEMASLLADLPMKLVIPGEIGLDLEVEENGRDYAENAALKARAFAAASGLASLADDSGLEVDALEGRPGLHSARLVPNGSAADRRKELLRLLQEKPRPWRARFVSTVCLALPGGEVYFAEGECDGEIIPEARGEGGFGYDPIFYIEDLGRTMAELSLQEKNQLSHRARAIAEAKAVIRRELGLE
jgi:XTP/dITP diphosphohydrolase